jgi:hypothetical protein
MQVFTDTPTPAFRRLLIAVGIGVLLAGCGLILSRYDMHTTYQSDFTFDYLGTLAFYQGESLYVSFTPDHYAAVGLVDAAHYNFHPPFSGLLFLPLVPLGYPAAITLWTWGSTLLYLAIWAAVLRELKLLPPAYLLPLMAGLVLFWDPFLFHTIVAPLSMVLAGCVTGAWLLLRRRRDALAGVLVALATLIKLFPGLLIIYFLVRRRWWALGAWGATMVLGLLLTGLVFGFDDLITYHTEVMFRRPPSAQQGPIHNLSLLSVFDRFLVGGTYLQPIVAVPLVAQVLKAATFLGVVLATMYALWRFAPTPHGIDHGFAMVCVAFLLISPSTWGHALVMLIMPLVLLLADALRSEDWLLRRTLLPVFVLVSLPELAIARMVSGYYQNDIPWYGALVTVLPIIGLLGCWALVWYAGLRVSRPAPVAPLPASSEVGRRSAPPRQV